MAYPPGVKTRMVSFGGAATVEAGTPLDIRISTVASRSLIWVAEGYRLESLAASYQSALEGDEILFEVPTTDQSGWLDAETRQAIIVEPGQASHLYTTTLDIYQSGGSKLRTYTVGPYAVPDEPGVLDGDLINPDMDPVSGTLTTFIPGPKGPQGLDGSNVLPTDTAIAQAISTPGSETQTQLNAAFVAPLGGTPGEPAAAFKGDPDGTDATDSTKRITLESYQRPELGPWGESIRFLNKKPQAKTMLAWYTPVNPNLPWHATTNPMNPKADAWLGAHWAGQTDGTGIHGHISIETPMANGDLYSRFGIDFIDHATGARGKDVTHTYIANSHFTHRQGDGSVFRIASGPGSSERRIEFSASGYVVDGGPGQVDETARRWWMVMDQSPEAGSNQGSNFLLRRFADNGAPAGTVMFVDRVKGNVTFGEASAQWAQVSAIGPGVQNHSFQSAPKAALSGGFAHFAAVSRSAADMLFDAKVLADAESRLRINSNGKIEWGNGSSAREVTLERKSNNVLGTGTANAFRTGLSATGSRPSPASVGQGSQFFDTTLNKPIWSTGSAWVDATGETV